MESAIPEPTVASDQMKMQIAKIRVQRVSVSTQAYACMLGGPERRTLYICTAESSSPEECRAKLGGRIEALEVDVPGAGLP